MEGMGGEWGGEVVNGGGGGEWGGEVVNGGKGVVNEGGSGE